MNMDKIAQLAKLREPFASNHISKLPKPTKAQTDEVKANYRAGMRCTICGGWHHKDVIHLDYVGHAALTDRLLTVDPEWTWEPLALDANGLPAIDKDGGLWIRLTICGVTRLGYGDAQGKTGGDAMKERIGDALRNAGMRFGAALDLWHKGDLHGDESDPPKQPEPPKPETKVDDFRTDDILLAIRECSTMEELQEVFTSAYKSISNNPTASRKLTEAKDIRKKELSK
jgi:hypothetical protein